MKSDSPSLSGTIPLPWNQASRYWLFVRPGSRSIPGLSEALITIGMQAHDGNFMLEAPAAWADEWKRVAQALKGCGGYDAVSVAIYGSDTAPTAMQLASHYIPAMKADAIALNLWLGESLVLGQLIYYFQPVVRGHDSLFGYEAFVRLKRKDGELMSGAAILSAAKALDIEYPLDRFLQAEAIKAFAATGFGGSLFVNFMPGFIQRPEVYLEGLTQTARAYGIVPKHLVLDFMHGGQGYVVPHLKRICEYCRERGYSIALDDIRSPADADALLSAIHPNYIKLDMHLVRRAEYDTIATIVKHCHRFGATVIAEGVETEQSFAALKSVEVDLFQGYLFSPPLPAEELRSKRISS